MSTAETIIAENIGFVREKISEAASRSGRKASDIKLMAVTKFRSVEEIAAAYRAGIRLFGENRVQEALEKFPHGTADFPGASLHMIGNLQRNKVKAVLPIINCIQSVSGTELLAEIAKRLAFEQNQRQLVEASRPMVLLLEVHTAEESKSGFLCDDDIARAMEFAERQGVCIGGFMTMAPFTTDREAVRRSFVKLRETAERMRRRFPSFPLNELSMGMSGDFETAVEEGATLVRIGSRLFQNRVSEAGA